MLIIKNRAKNKTRSVLALMELEVDAVKHFLPSLAGLSKEYSDYASDILKADTTLALVQCQGQGCALRVHCRLPPGKSTTSYCPMKQPLISGEHLKCDEYELQHAVNVKYTLHFKDSTKNEYKYLIHMLY